jgi:hypothetical protein
VLADSNSYHFAVVSFGVNNKKLFDWSKIYFILDSLCKNRYIFYEFIVVDFELASKRSKSHESCLFDFPEIFAYIDKNNQIIKFRVSEFLHFYEELYNESCQAWWYGLIENLRKTIF